MPMDLPETQYLCVFWLEKNEFDISFKKPEFFKMAA